MAESESEEDHQMQRRPRQLVTRINFTAIMYVNHYLNTKCITWMINNDFFWWGGGGGGWGKFIYKITLNFEILIKFTLTKL